MISFGYRMSQIACWRNWIFEFHQKLKTACFTPAAGSLEEHIKKNEPSRNSLHASENDSTKSDFS